MNLGRRWGEEARPGWVFALTGDLGSGKTQLVRGLAQGMGVQSGVHSPTFALLHIYDGGRLPLHHLDLYRLSSREAIVQAGLEEYLYSRNAVAVIEWAERWFGEGPDIAAPGLEKVRWVHFEVLAGEDREIRYEDLGA